MRQELPLILLVEDDPDHPFLTGIALRSEGPPAPIHIASSGGRAVACLEGLPPYLDGCQGPAGPRSSLPLQGGAECRDWTPG